MVGKLIGGAIAPDGDVFLNSTLEFAVPDIGAESVGGLRDQFHLRRVFQIPIRAGIKRARCIRLNHWLCSPDREHKS